MIKASTPVVVLLLSFIFGLEKPSARLFVYIWLITTGVTISCVSQVDFNSTGVVLQLSAIVCEALRLCLVSM